MLGLVLLQIDLTDAEVCGLDLPMLSAMWKVRVALDDVSNASSSLKHSGSGRTVQRVPSGHQKLVLDTLTACLASSAAPWLETLL